jgi:hypothetical protein
VALMLESNAAANIFFFRTDSHWQNKASGYVMYWELRRIVAKLLPYQVQEGIDRIHHAFPGLVLVDIGKM